MSLPNEFPRDNGHRWAVFGVLSSVYFLVYFHRVSTSVIVPDLLAAFQTDAMALGAMSSMYFYLYALEQPLVGYLSDRLGPRRVVGAWNLIAGLGCVVFGLAPSIEWAAVGRALIGFGVGGVYVPGMKAFSQWFQRKDFATVTGFFLAAGNLGAVVATTPLAWLASTWGWRASFLCIGGVTVGLAASTLLFVREHPGLRQPKEDFTESRSQESEEGQGSALRVLASVEFWVLGVIFFGFFGSVLTFQGLWATPFLMAAFEIERLEASGLNLLIPLGFIVGAPLYGRLTDRFFRNKVQVLLQVLAIQTVLWAVLAFCPGVLGEEGMIPLLLLMGATAGGFATALWGLVRDTTEENVLGRVTGFLNPAPFLGVAVLQVVTGAVLDRVGRIGEAYPAHAYEKAFLVCLVVMGLCLVLCAGFRKRLSPDR